MWGLTVEVGVGNSLEVAGNRLLWGEQGCRW